MEIFKKKITYIEQVAYESDISDEQYKILCMNCSKHAIKYVTQYKKVEQIKHFIDNINNVINTVITNEIATPIIQDNIICLNEIMFEETIYNNFEILYNNINVKWVCPYMRNNIINNINEIKLLLTNENVILENERGELRNLLSKYKMSKEYRQLLQFFKL